MISPGVSLVTAAYAVGMSAPSLIFGRSITGTSGGRMLETLIRLMLPMPAARSALSNALRAVPPSARPAVAAAIVTFPVIRSSSTEVLASNRLPFEREQNLLPIYRRDAPMQEKSAARTLALAPPGASAASFRGRRTPRRGALGGGAVGGDG